MPFAVSMLGLLLFLSPLCVEKIMQQNHPTSEAEQRLHEPPPPKIEAFLAGPYPLSAEMVAEHRKNGHVKLEQAIS